MRWSAIFRPISLPSGSVRKLTSIVAASLAEAPTLSQFYARLSRGELSLRSPIGQAAFGQALLRQGLE